MLEADLEVPKSKLEHNNVSLNLIYLFKTLGLARSNKLNSIRYEIPTKVGEGPKYQMVGTKYDPRLKEIGAAPGPGQYNPEIT